MNRHHLFNYFYLITLPAFKCDLCTNCDFLRSKQIGFEQNTQHSYELKNIKTGQLNNVFIKLFQNQPTSITGFELSTPPSRLIIFKFYYPFPSSLLKSQKPIPRNVNTIKIKFTRMQILPKDFLMLLLFNKIAKEGVIFIPSPFTGIEVKIL